MNVLFVSYETFTSPGPIQIFHFAEALRARGFGCAVCVPNRKEAVSAIGQPGFQVLDYAEAAIGITFADGGPADIIHAWTPRECVRKLTAVLRSRDNCPYVIDLEDNEEQIVEDALGTPFRALAFLPEETLDRLVGDSMSHPRRYREFLEGASGASVIMDRLLEFVPDGLPTKIVWPGFAKRFLDLPPGDRNLRKSLGIDDDEYLLVYPGNAHASNRGDLRSLYLAIGLVRRRGFRVKLLRIGDDHVQILENELQEPRAFIIDIGYQDAKDVPRYLALADLLVQPGRSNPFNEFRLPAKLPEFLASGRPVIMPAAGLGRHLTDGHDCLLLHNSTALEIAQQIERLLPDPDLRQRLGAGGKEFAVKNLSWEVGAERLSQLYDAALEYAARNPSKASRQRSELTVPSSGAQGSNALSAKRSPAKACDVRENYIDDLYSVFLARTPEAEERAAWVSLLERGGTDREMFYRFKASAEYQLRSRVRSAHFPGHYHSPVVDPEELRKRFRIDRRTDPENLAGIRISRENMMKVWEQLRPYVVTTDFASRKEPRSRYYANNEVYPIGDATILRAMILATKPSRVIEIGSGFSSACMLDALDEAGNLDVEVTFIEPYPERLLGLLRPSDHQRCRIVRQPVQALDLNFFDSLEADDILFIDSTHVLKTGSDVHFELFEVLPRLKAGVLIHVHDIQYPFEYPDSWIFDLNYSWNEIYAVRAFLMYNHEFEIVYFNSFFASAYRALIEQTYPPMLQNTGGSLWLRKTVG